MSSLEGVAFLDHTADVGIDVTASTRSLLFRRAARGMMALLQGADDADPAPDGAGHGAGSAPGSGAGPGSREVRLAADDPVGLLAAWLKELLFLHEAAGVDYVDAVFETLTDTALEARVETAPGPPAVREIKGVTYHELTAKRTNDGWHARVIFDV